MACHEIPWLLESGVATKCSSPVIRMYLIIYVAGADPYRVRGVNGSDRVGLEGILLGFVSNK